MPTGAETQRGFVRRHSSSILSLVYGFLIAENSQDNKFPLLFALLPPPAPLLLKAKDLGGIRGESFVAHKQGPLNSFPPLSSSFLVGVIAN